MIIMGDLVSLSKLFNQKIFRIPDYQRGYAWKEQQLEDFWDDLYNLNGDRIHYTGMLSLKLLKKSACESWLEEKWILNNDYEPYHVVDGQQRLTTFIILLNSIVNLAEKIEETHINDTRLELIREKYIVQYNRGGISKAYKFGYEIDNPSFEYMRYGILGEEGGGTLAETFYTLNLQNAKDFFDKKIAEVYEQKGYSAVEAIFSKLTNRLHFNIHYIDDDFDVFVAFETMNNRGKKLSNLEILKNRLIYLTTIYPADVLPVEDREQMRRDINKAWAEVYKQLGRNKDNPLDDDEYLKNHWTMYFKYSRTSGDDYIQFLLNKQFTPKAIYGEHVQFDVPASDEEDYENQMLNTTIDSEDNKLNPIEIKEYVKSLHQVAQYWYYSFNPNDSYFSEEEKLWINRLNRIGIAYFRTLVVASFINKKVTEAERIELFKVIERFIFTSFRMAKYNTSWLSNVSYTYARDLLKGNKEISEITEFFRKNTDENLDGMMTAFANDMKRHFSNYDGYYSWVGLKYVLFEYEAELAKGRNMPRISSWEYFTKTPKDKVSIEHIYPQKPSKWYWRNQFRKYPSDAEKHALANSLGNLLALSMSVNSSLQNDDFKSKKQNRYGYDKGSYSEGEVAILDDWTPEEILKRGIHLLEFIEKRWNLSLGSYESKVSLLGLTFLLDGRPDVPEVQEIDYSSRDEHFKGEKGEMKVSEHLKKKDLYLIEYYFEIFEALKEKIPSLYETATNHYIALRCAETSKNLAEIHIQNSKRKICIITKSPSTEGYTVGEKLPDNFLWSLNYRIYLKEKENFDQALNIIFEAYQTRISSGITDEEIEDETKRAQIVRTADMLALVKEYESKGVVQILHSNNRYIRFTTPIIREKVGMIGDGTWNKINDLVVYEVNDGFDDAVVSLYIGPGAEEDRNKWIEFARSNPIFKVLKGQKWTPIYRVTLFKEDDSDALEVLAEFIEKSIPMIDEEFKKL